MGDVTPLDAERATNLFGPLGDDAKARLVAVIRDPTDATWHDAFSLILNHRTGTTLWQAVLAVDPGFPRTGPGITSGRRQPWPQIPTKRVLLEALRYAVDPPTVTCGMDPGGPDLPGSYHHGPHRAIAVCQNPQPADQTDTPPT